MFEATPWQLTMKQLPGRSQAQQRAGVQLTLLLEHGLKISCSASATQPAREHEAAQAHLRLHWPRSSMCASYGAMIL